ncbi:hypothetical protein, partial [Salmonella sp. s51228]|uniref:hypothetical protein n=1 Tax=Salmonella sp. s51228 TaxID=3159652 RepID=UPI00397F7074
VYPGGFSSIQNHIENGLTDASQYISTTASEQRAIDWGRNADLKTSRLYRNSRDTIVRIDVDYLKSNHRVLTDRAYDFTRNDVRRRHLSTDKAR